MATSTIEKSANRKERRKDKHQNYTPNKVDSGDFTSGKYEEMYNQQQDMDQEISSGKRSDKILSHRSQKQFKEDKEDYNYQQEQKHSNN